eukprot:c19478_g1_i3 orf=183-392(+)
MSFAQENHKEKYEAKSMRQNHYHSASTSFEMDTINISSVCLKLPFSRKPSFSPSLGKVLTSHLLESMEM